MQGFVPWRTFPGSVALSSRTTKAKRGSLNSAWEKAQSGAVLRSPKLGVSMRVLSRSNRAVALSIQASVASAPARSPAHLRFGPYELDPKAGELRIGEIKIVLQDQPCSILLMLIERAGDVLTRDEIQKRLWPERHR